MLTLFACIFLSFLTYEACGWIRAHKEKLIAETKHIGVLSETIEQKTGSETELIDAQAELASAQARQLPFARLSVTSTSGTSSAVATPFAGTPPDHAGGATS